MQDRSKIELFRQQLNSIRSTQRPTVIVGSGGLGDIVTISALCSLVKRAHPDSTLFLLWQSGPNDTNGQPAVQTVLQGHPAGITHLTTYNLARPLIVELICQAKLTCYDWRHVTMHYDQGQAPANASIWSRYFNDYPASLGLVTKMNQHFETIMSLSAGLPEVRQEDYYTALPDPATLPDWFEDKCKRVDVILHAESAGLPNHKGWWWQGDKLQDALRGLQRVPIGFAQVGGKKDHRLPECLDLRGVPLNLVSHLISKAKLFIGCDSGPMYMAHAFKVPSIILFGPTPASFLAWKDNLNLQHDLPTCPPCFYNEPNWCWDCSRHEQHCVNMVHFDDKAIKSQIETFVSNCLGEKG